ncbi:MAG: hypothetical protein ACRDXE_10490 [Acidimicrobiales bacterium]
MLGRAFSLHDGKWDDRAAAGPRLFITVHGADSFHTERQRPNGTAFLFPVPAVTYNRASWQRWLWDRVIDVHRHETGEAFRFVYRRPSRDGTNVEVAEHPFAPFHGPGRDPNRNVEVGVDPMEAESARAAAATRAGGGTATSSTTTPSTTRA